MDYKQKLDGMISTLVSQGASDLHLSSNSEPIIRVSGVLTPLLSEGKLTPEDTKGLIAVMLSPELLARFSEHQEVDFSYSYGEVARFRGNVFNQRGAVGAVFRTIPWEIKGFDALGLPTVVRGLSVQSSGVSSG